MPTIINGTTGIDQVQDDSVDIADLSATGTPSSSTYLRGDNSWATISIPAGGKVLQVVTGTFTSNAATSSTSFVDTGLSCSITPSATSSKIAVFAYTGVNEVLGFANESISFQILRNSTTVNTALNHLFESGTSSRRSPVTLTILDSPSTTSSITYKVQFRSRLGNSVDFNANSDTSNIILMEIGA
jgi:hypothetical protein